MRQVFSAKTQGVFAGGAPDDGIAEHSCSFGYGVRHWRREEKPPAAKGLRPLESRTILTSLFFERVAHRSGPLSAHAQAGSTRFFLGLSGYCP
ncbi:hypothetical protein G3N56_07185 [Desulfovibrio sulfodismutans]|uniref:Uncharacterized protein n=1 Tax=Desulfolutivibrio sulfodismutans TaxID=63561 RepID=A0A7K3NL68_9BACT|nr:hypothetical protein [Desulfolutivibrio sulfodismutans]NDY56525.1 hypothetical protein [Desulfolutivibrio sulfodismutans]QLA12614.1 hypothetical protein GD606_10185 [Desulfolutivibrio sulfodismutans DSM 3696]